MSELNAVIGETPPVTLVSTNIIDPSCGNDNGEFSVIASGGTPPFSYTLNGNPINETSFTNLGEGTYFVAVFDAVNCIEEVVVTLVDAGVPEVTIASQIDDSCNNGVGGFTLDVTNGQGPYEFDLGTGRVNTNVFTDLIAGSYQVTVTDQNNCSEVIQVILENNGVEPTSSFTFDVIDNQVTAQSTAVGADNLEWDFGDGGSSTGTNVNYQYQGAGIFNLCLTAINDCGSMTSCEFVEVVLPLSDFTIGDAINRVDGTGIGQVTLSTMGQPDVITGADGSYLIEGLPEGDNYEIIPTKDINHRNGVTVLDIIDVRSHLLFIDTFDTPYQYIAADVNRNGSVTVFDLVVLQQIVLEAIDRFPQNTSWDFLPADYTFSYASQALNYNYPQSIFVNNLTTDYLDADFTGVKIGDTNDSNNPALVSNENSLWQIEDRSVTAGELVEISVHISESRKLLGFEAGLNFDPSLLELQQVSGTTDYQVKEGQLKMLWYTDDDQNEGRMISPEMDLITLQFLAHTDLEKISDAINFLSPSTRQLSYDAQRTERNIEWTFTDALVTSTDNFGLNVPKLYPNPFNQQTFFTFELTQASNVSIEIFDLTGKSIFHLNETRLEGAQKIGILGTHFPVAGTYIYRLKINDQISHGRIIKQ